MNNKPKREIYPNSSVVYWTSLNTILAIFIGIINGFAVMLISDYLKVFISGWTQNNINVFFFVIIPIIMGFLSIFTIPKNQRFADNASIMVIGTTIGISLITIFIQGTGYIGLSCLCLFIPCYFIVSGIRSYH